MGTNKKDILNNEPLNKIDMKLNRAGISEVTDEEEMGLINSFTNCNLEITDDIRQSLLELIDGFYFILTENFTFQYISPSVTDKLGFSCEELIDKPFDYIFSDNSNRHIIELLSGKILIEGTGGNKHSLEVEAVNRKKECKAFRLSLARVKDSDYILGICIDVNHYKVREKELINAKNTAEYNDKLKSEFLANMSHEIRTPLNGIVGFTSMLDRKDLLDEKREKYLRIIHSSTSHLLTLVSDIIDISKIEVGQLKIFTNKVDVHQMLEDLLATFVSEAQRLGKKNIRIVKQVEKPSVRLSIKTDEVRLKQVMNNLLGNAIKFTNQGDIRFGYSLIGSDSIRFFVRDSGIGISKSAQKTLFNRFEQTKEGEKNVYKGTGLGLAISRGIIELMGGKIGLQSEPGEGSEFFFTLPLTDS